MFRQSGWLAYSLPVTRRTLLLVFVLGLSCLLLGPPVAAQRNTLVLQQNLAELVQEAGLIIHGRVTAVRAEPHPQFANLHTIVVTLDVIEVLKGKTGAPFSFRQYIHDLRDFQGKLGYHVGQEYLLLLIKPSQYGLSSPAGLEQGRFRVVSDAQGNRTLVNGHQNSGLFHNIQKTVPGLDARLAPAERQLVLQHRSGPLGYDRFKYIIEVLVAGSK